MDTRRASLSQALPLAGIMVAGLAFRLWGLTWGLTNANVDRRPQPDEWVVYWLFRWFTQHHNLNPCPDVAGGQCFFDWGAVYPYLAFLVHQASLPFLAGLSFGPHADPSFVQAVLAGRILSALTSTLTILATYFLGRAAFGHRAGILAALLVSLSGLLIELAHFASPDSTTLLLCTLTLLAAIRYTDRARLVSLLAGGALAGLALGSEYHMVLLAVPLLAAWALAEIRPVQWLLLGIVTALSTFVIANPYILIEFAGFRAALLHTLAIRTVDSRLEYGNRFASYGPSWFYPIHYVLGYGMGLAATIWMVLGAGWGLISHRKHDLILLAWIIPYAVLISVSSAKFLRYGAPLLPATSVLAGRLAVDVWERFRPSLRWSVLTATLLVTLYSGAYDAAYAKLFASTDPRVVAVRWLHRHAPRGTRVGFQSLPDGLINLPYFVTAAGYRPCFSLFQSTRLNGPMAYILVDSYTLEEHSRFSDAQVARFQRALSTSPHYRLVARINYVPSILGLSFPLSGSPHDWRYAAHTISIYRHLDPQSGPAPYCFSSIKAATTALYVPADKG